MNLSLLRRTFGAQRLKLIVASLALGAWGFFMPVIWNQFGRSFQQLTQQNLIPKEFQQFTRFGGGDITQLPGMIAIGFIHPIAIILLGLFTVGFTVAAVAGERQRGTLEVVLARPVSRRSYYVTLLFAAFVFVGVAILGLIAGVLLSVAIFGLSGNVQIANMPLLWANGVLLHMTFASIALAASVSFDRLSPALGITLAVLLVSYFLEVLGSLWPDADVLQPYSLFYYLQPQKILEGHFEPFHAALLGVITVAAIAYALLVFPRRDLAAPA